MSMAIIITFCVLLLLAYIFDLTSARTKIPSVILMLLLGWIVRQASGLAQIVIPDLTSVLPVLGTVGLILIVLEGSLELELDKSKLPLVGRTTAVALLSMLSMSFLLAFIFQGFGQASFKDSLVNAIPLCIISSAIAIPSVKKFSAPNKEFVIYESSLSDIFGFLFFNFVALNSVIHLGSFGSFVLELIVIAVISFAATAGLSFLLAKIDHHVKFVPIILSVILIYSLSKMYHLPALIFILIFGLFLSNLDEMKSFRWIRKLHPEELNDTVHKFKEMTAEIAFLVRALFFLLFGYLIETSELFNPQTLLWAVGITSMAIGIRAAYLRFFGVSLKALLFIAPRGLITILLFLAIAPENTIPLMNKSLIVQVIVLSALIMVGGTMVKKKVEDVVAKIV